MDLEFIYSASVAALMSLRSRTSKLGDTLPRLFALVPDGIDPRQYTLLEDYILELALDVAAGETAPALAALGLSETLAAASLAESGLTRNLH